MICPTVGAKRSEQSTTTRIGPWASRFSFSIDTHQPTQVDDRDKHTACATPYVYSDSCTVFRAFSITVQYATALNIFGDNKFSFGFGTKTITW